MLGLPTQPGKRLYHGWRVTTYLGFLDSVSPDTSPESDYQGRAVSIKQSQQSRS